jgi:hypothetical protein
MERIKKIKKHVPKHIRPVTVEDFGCYLAGLIDGDGYFGTRQFVLAFHVDDSFLAYFLKEFIGYGSVYKNSVKKSVTWVVSKKEGLEKIINLVNGKLRVPFKIECIEKNILMAYTTPLKLEKPLTLNTSEDLDNYWLAGFCDADGSFQIKILSRLNRTNYAEIRLNFQVDQKTSDLLFLIQKKFGGNIGYRSSQDTYYYGSTSFGSAKNVIQYFDTYHLQSNKYLNYRFWRRAYILIQDGDHLTQEGYEKIKKLKMSMNKNLSEHFSLKKEVV